MEERRGVQNASLYSTWKIIALPKEEMAYMNTPRKLMRRRIDR